MCGSGGRMGWSEIKKSVGKEVGGDGGKGDKDRGKRRMGINMAEIGTNVIKLCTYQTP